MAESSKMTRTQRKPWCVLPAGRLLSQPAEDEGRFVVVESRRRAEYWIVSAGWRTGSIAAGPFRPCDVLRAHRLANTLVPDGCELGPWQHGLSLFQPSALPGQADDWARVDPSWLPPSVSQYTAADVREVPARACCAPPADRPRLDWLAASELGGFERGEALIEALYPEHKSTAIATLSRSWNVHPPGSPLFAAHKSLDGEFFVIDL